MESTVAKFEALKDKLRAEIADELAAEKRAK
jgi:hypothetical protein